MAIKSWHSRKYLPPQWQTIFDFIDKSHPEGLIPSATIQIFSLSPNYPFPLLSLLSQPQNCDLCSDPQIELAMRVHPAPMKRNLTLLRGAAAGGGARQRKLRRLPHVFSKVLELPFGADADVAIRENVEGFQFVAAAVGVGRGVRAHTVEIHPGVMKVVIWEDAGPVLDGLELDRWRFRLPASTRPALATAEYVDGELVVTVPKGVGSDEDGDVDLRGGSIGIGQGQLVVAVQ